MSKVMRDVLIENLTKKMFCNDKIFFISADFGSPALDKLRNDFPDRFINVGIAEQNLINIATGIALEGFIVYAYAIASFLSMRCYEQIRNLSLLSQIREININLISVGAGLSYDVTGPTHHCLEDISLMRTLPNFIVFSPSDYILTEKFIDFSINAKKPKYLRLDGKAVPPIYADDMKLPVEKGFAVLKEGRGICLLSTGYMTHKAQRVSEKLKLENIDIGVIDIFLLKPFKIKLLFDALRKYKTIITMEEGFINKGGLDNAIANILINNKSFTLKRIGFDDRYIFEVGDREYLHKINKTDEESIIKIIKKESLLIKPGENL